MWCKPRVPKAFGIYVAASLGFEPRKRLRLTRFWALVLESRVRPQAFYAVAASLGFEPRQRDSESLVLPLHHEARSEKIKDR